MSLSTSKSCTGDQIAAMRRQEESPAYLRHDYLTRRKDAAPPCPRVAPSKGGPVDTACRALVFDWIITIVDHCGFDRETAHVASSYVDRYLSSDFPDVRRTLEDRRLYQLVFLSAMHVAVKIHEGTELDVSLLLQLSRGMYSTREFADTEERILRVLDWRLCEPMAATFVRLFLSLLPDHGGSKPIQSAVDYFCRYQIQLAAREYSFVAAQQSTVAVSAILNAIESIDFRHFSASHRSKFIKQMEDLANIDLFSNDIHKMQLQLRKLFEESGQEAFHQFAPKSSQTYVNKGSADESGPSTNSSPVCVTKLSLGNYKQSKGAKLAQ